MQSIVLANSSPRSLLASQQAWRLPNRGVDNMSSRSAAIGLALTVSLLGAACSSPRAVPATDTRTATDHPAPSAPGGTVSSPDAPGPPPDAAGALARLASSPRHSEWVMIRTG